MSKKIIKISESQLQDIVKRVLVEQGNMVGTAGLGMQAPFMDYKKYNNNLLHPFKKNINPRGLKKGMGGRNDSKNIESVKELQSELIRLGLLDLSTGPTGYFGNLTQKALDRYNSDDKSTASQPTKDKVSQTAIDKKIATAKDKIINRFKENAKGPYCIALTTEECAKINPNSQTEISTGSETRCSAYMVKCLSQYDSDLFGGNAWDVFNNVKNTGTVKYNAYNDGSVNWNYIYSQLKKNKIGKSICNQYAAQDNADRIVKSSLPQVISSSIPQSSKISINSLQLGDIVGLYHSGSDNKGMAFCQKALEKGLDDTGNINQDQFTFNSHVGFVGAVKNGIPIIIHNVHGHHMATPATKMLNKNSEDMIVWVISDQYVADAIAGKPKSYWDSFVSKVNSLNPF